MYRNLEENGKVLRKYLFTNMHKTYLFESY